ncbi:efflux RND transporter permease subunit [Oscillatoria sp. CS-180]|uniref:efflux RND transporter permease subunit n=1 Tax=Oscillatoria sp. CS-180 TaxID=3021720 RepID=UPI00232F3F27|nr:efflux RND transporter permease subunit [Oscillatoria sp. CS-180]MDB9528970.1 efflux RND transporter permease subunit [Oscillatoria sp. CS-180]
MSFNVSGWSIRRPIPTLVLFLVLTLAGLVSFNSLGIDLNPNIDLPSVIVTVGQTGAGPQELETQVTKKVEDAVAGLGNIDEIYSTITDGNSQTIINFVLGTDTDRATNDVRDAIARIRSDLPAAANDPIVRRLNFEGGPILTYAVISDQRSVEELSDLVDREISRSLLSVPGVAQVNRIGGVDPEIRVDLDPNQLDALGITASQVNNQIRALNVNLPSGRATVSQQEQGLRTLGSAPTVEALANYRIQLPNGTAVPLKSLGSVERGFAEARQAAYFNTQPVVAFSVLRSTGSVLVSVEEGVTDQVAVLEESLPEDITLQLIFTRATDIRDSYQASIEALIIGCILAVVVVGVFLRDWRATLITATALPLSIIPTFLVIDWFGYTLNSMSLLGLTLAVGNLVDDAIVEIENVERHIRMGKPPFKAAINSTAEVGLAVITTTATIVAVFIPVAFMGGIPGQFFKPFGVTVATATMFSTLVARLMTPMMAAYLLKPKPAKLEPAEPALNGNGNGRAPRRRFHPYQSLLKAGLRHRLLTIALAVMFFIGSLMLVPYIPTSLFEAGDTGLSTIVVELPPGSTLRDTHQVTGRLTTELLTHEAVQNILTSEGRDGVNQASLFVRLKPEEERVASQDAFEKDARQLFSTIPGARISFESQGAGGQSKDLTIILKGDNPTTLLETSSALTRQMREIPGLVEVTSSASLVKPEILITPDPLRAADLGVSVQEIANTAFLATLGDTESNLAEFTLGDRQIPIRIQLNPEYRDQIDTLRQLKVPGENGNLVPLVAVADIAFGSGPAQIDRFDRARQVTIGGNLQGITLGQGLAAVNTLPALQNLPPDVQQQPAGDAEIMQEIFGRFLLALGTAVLMIYAVLVLLYNSFLYPAAVMAALPLSIGGALMGLLVTQKPLGLFALIGVVLLMGLVTKNAILLVDYALMAKAEGKSRRQAVMEAGTTRLRPILMTSISTMAGMIPIALEWGAGSETRSPMAIAVIGGFSTSTLLTLVVVPVFFTYIDGFQSGIRNLLRRLNGSNPKSPLHKELKAYKTPAGK